MSKKTKRTSDDVTPAKKLARKPKLPPKTLEQRFVDERMDESTNADSRFSGWFDASRLTPEWRGHTKLAEMCQDAGMSNSEARAVCLYVVWDKAACEIAPVLGVARKNVWRLLHRAGRKALRRWPDIGKALDTIYEGPRQEAIWILNAFRNSKGSGRTPLYMQNVLEEYRLVTPPVMVEWRQICKTDMPLDTLDALGKMAETI